MQLPSWPPSWNERRWLLLGDALIVISVGGLLLCLWVWG